MDGQQWKNDNCKMLLHDSFPTKMAALGLFSFLIWLLAFVSGNSDVWAVSNFVNLLSLEMTLHTGISLLSFRLLIIVYLKVIKFIYQD